MSGVELTQAQTVLVTGAGTGIGRAIAFALARAGHHVYASMRDLRGKNHELAAALSRTAVEESIRLSPLELDVLSDVGCRAAVDHILAVHGRLDVVVNNAGMLMQGITEAFSAEQLMRIFDTNALSWLRVNQAALPPMRRQGGGVLMYVGSTTSRLHEPFLGPYIASKVAGEALAEIMGMEVRAFGIETVILVPGAFTSGTDHFAHAEVPAYHAVEGQYGDLMSRAVGLGDCIKAIDNEYGLDMDVTSVGEAARRVLALPAGTRPSRVVIDGQSKGLEDINAIHHERQSAFLMKLGLTDLSPPPPEAQTDEAHVARINP